MAQSTVSSNASAAPVDAADAVTRPLPHWTGWLRHGAPALLGVLVAGYALCAAAVAIVAALAAGDGFSTAAVLRSAASAWLAAHHVPLTVDGVRLGMLPLLLVLVMAYLAARAAATVAERLGLCTPAAGTVVAGMLAAGNGLVGVLVAALTGTASPAQAFAGCAAVCGLGALAGVRSRCGLVAAATSRLDPVTAGGARLGGLAVAALICAGALVLAVGTATTVSTGGSLFASAAPGAGSGIGMLLLCACYLPNAVVAALSFAAGPGFSAGQLAVSTVGFHGGPLPAVPLLAAVPGQFAMWWPLFWLLPAAAAALVGWVARDVHPAPLQRLRAVAVAGLVAAISCLALAALAGGTLGSGAVGPVVVPSGALALSVFGWVAVVGGAVAYLAGARASTGERAADTATDTEHRPDDGEEPVATGAATTAAPEPDDADPPPDPAG